MGKGGGGQQQQQPTSSTVTNTNLPAWAQPYSEKLLGQAGALTDINQNPYQQYQGQRLADFTPMQQQAFNTVNNMQVSPQNQQATNLAGAAGLGSLGAGQQYNQMATNPGAIQAFMSPYQQNVTDFQKQQAVMDYGRQLPGMGAAASNKGAFGGSRQAIVEGEGQRNLQNQLAGIQATGSQNAFQNAQQAQQFGSSLGLQGYNQALQGANTLGQLGQNQYGQQMGINAAQQQVGAQQQAFNQQGLTNQYQNFLDQQNYPYQQLGFMSDILHGQTQGRGITTQQKMEAAPTAFNNMMSLGLGAYGASKLLGAEGGVIKGYKEGGEVKKFVGGGIAGGMSIEAQYQLALTMRPKDLDAIIKGQQRSDISAGVAAAALPVAIKNATASAGIQAQQELAKSPGSVIDRMMAQNQPAQMPEDQGGVASLPAENMNDVAQAAEGGVMGYAGGGGVQHFQNKGKVEGEGQEDEYNRHRRENPFIPETPAQVLARRTALEDALGAGVDATRSAAGTVAAGARNFNSAVTEPFRAAGRLMGVPIMGGLRMLGVDAPSPYSRPASNPTTPAPAVAAAPAAPVVAAPPAAAPVAAPATVRTRTPPQGLEQLGYSEETAKRLSDGIAATDAAKTAATPTQEPAGIADLQVGPPKPEGYAAFKNQVTSASQGYLDEATNLLKGLTATNDERNEAKAQATGIAFIRAAAALRKMGPSGDRQADAMEALAKGAQDYTATDKADKKAALAAGMSLAMAKATLAQGDTKIAADMYNQSENMLMEGKKLAVQAGHWTKQDETAYLKAMGDIEEGRAKIKLFGQQGILAGAQATRVDSEIKENLGRANYYNQPRGGITPAIRDKAADNAGNVMKSLPELAAWKAKFPNDTLPALRDRIYKSELRRLSGDATKPESAQVDKVPNAAEVAGRVTP